mmetsp:Transcript_26448/g.36126  ORF Transcript_26448/g.36126 Transcript_26448/m.36126 type:complete len:101 (+) Transcript_26448:597-899(+)|eukprot:CAMPEP_0176348712 /NCGR_PEP_ID=MMETSP0126-20121128/8079_1 /TAXON_ID=141414 ORGANISM="Strombidinopsis acuminatum, Strain SPMC142" /NCGR_SAMPLE_ID=MMETSP0126 /ASSEMBLY_ACC=CAM_ASM_000229 /LENGTH=100 /DNA_ID=CAMNT_0017697657 /DNA_START=795 /DNA_END=1097 /DNA_ORIENTATION=+
MTIKQLDKLSSKNEWFKTDENFIGAYFEKQFAEELSKENQESWTDEEKFENLEVLYKHAKSKDMPDEFCLVFLGQILALSAELETFNVEYFEEYIEKKKL